MKFEPIQPPDFLKEYVRYFFTLESDCVSETRASFRTVADGCPGLIFQLSEKGTFYDQNKYHMPGTFIYGQATKPREIISNEKFSALGVYFYPHALNSIFGFNAAELTDSCVDLDVIPQRYEARLSNLLLNTPTHADRVSILSTYLYSLIKSRKTPDTTLLHALSQIIQSNGMISIKKLQAELKLSQRSLERRFNQCVGISPKLFSRICRFQASLNQMRKSEYNKLSDVAFENEYADQSHFIRVFKEFTGISPYQYQSGTYEVVENLTGK